MIMLNTSLHNPNVRDKPGLERFVAMNRGINEGGDLPEELLRVRLPRPPPGPSASSPFLLSVPEPPAPQDHCLAHPWTAWSHQPAQVFPLSLWLPVFVSLFFILFFLLLHQAVCGILVPDQGLNSGSRPSDSLRVLVCPIFPHLPVCLSQNLAALPLSPSLHLFCFSLSPCRSSLHSFPLLLPFPPQAPPSLGHPTGGLTGFQ